MTFFRDDADKEFMECSELARGEIKAFHQKRITEFRLALLYYTEVLYLCPALLYCIEGVRATSTLQR